MRDIKLMLVFGAIGLSLLSIPRAVNSFTPEDKVEPIIQEVCMKRCVEKHLNRHYNQIWGSIDQAFETSKKFCEFRYSQNKCQKVTRYNAFGENTYTAWVDVR